MSLNNTPSSERIHIGILGKTNAGKSSLINAITGQEVSLVSGVRGTTTDPVKKAMELSSLGPVVFIDTPGLNDSSVLGKAREEKTQKILKQIHAALIVVDAGEGLTQIEAGLMEKLSEEKIPSFLVYNKADLITEEKKNQNLQMEKKFFSQKELEAGAVLYVSAKTGENIELLKEKLTAFKTEEQNRKLVSDLLQPEDHVVLIIPIDKAAPKGRLILPQQQTIRDILDAGCSLSICQVENLKDTMQLLQKPPKLVITDSQVFAQVKDIIPNTIMLTSFSVLFARYKGDLEGNVKGAFTIEHLEDGDIVLISEGCTHHRQCGDIGTCKLPAWLLKHTGKKLRFEFTSGTDFPKDLSAYKLIIHCGACMLNEKQMQARILAAKEQKVPMTNYGITIAYLNGILERSIEPFGRKR